MKRIIPMLALAAVLALAPEASAAQLRGSVTVQLDAGELPVTNGAVTAYLVGIPGEEGYRVLDRFGGGVIRREDVDSDALARWLAELAGGGRSQMLDVDGAVVFSGLEEGLYLLEQTEKMDGFYPFRPMLVTIPSGESWNLRLTPAVEPISPEPPATGDGQTILAMGAMLLSGSGLTGCVVWEFLRKHRQKNGIGLKKGL